MPEPSEAIKVTIQRGDAQRNWSEQFTVPARDNQTVLDVVSWIQQTIDPGLTYRFACRVGMCGSCAMMVNDIPRWTCRTHVNKALVDNRLNIAPLRNAPIIKDLVVDMDPFFDKWLAAEGLHHPSRTRNEPLESVAPDSQSRTQADAGIECINCSVCYAACDTVAGNEHYLGPAALQRAWTLLNDSRDADHQGILDAVSSKGGCHNCHSMGSCTEYCPVGLDPMSAIARLKRETVRGYFRPKNRKE